MVRMLLVEDELSAIRPYLNGLEQEFDACSNDGFRCDKRASLDRPRTFSRRERVSAVSCSSAN